MHVSDITGPLRAALAETGLTDGTATLFVAGATGALTTVEYEPGLVTDLEDFFEAILPKDREYRHNLRWGDGNGHSHMRATLLGPSLVVPFVDRELTLGTWQQVIFVDFDVPARQRSLVVQFQGV
jgi:secondary thiamine-phosphate synthase enzyme